jgi:hypothetical protein
MRRINGFVKGGTLEDRGFDRRMVIAFQGYGCGTGVAPLVAGRGAPPVGGWPTCSRTPRTSSIFVDVILTLLEANVR